MRPSKKLSTLASALLLVPSTLAQTPSSSLQWPHNLPPRVKYFPEHEHLIRRSLNAQSRLLDQNPTGMRKMSLDSGEMFFLEYWHFQESGGGLAGSNHGTAGAISVPHGSVGRVDDSDGASTNSSKPRAAELPILLHSCRHLVQPPLLARYLNIGRSPLYSRDFTCPGGTSSCASVGRPNSCCSSGLACTIIADTGLGDVGCCSSNSPCNGQVRSCPISYTACSANQGGGCCIPGYRCSGVGCAACPLSTLLDSALIQIV